VLLSNAPILDVRSLLTEERAELLELLRGISDEDWLISTPCVGWRVKDVALHLLDDDLGWLSRGRDRDPSGLLDMSGVYADFVTALDRKNQSWVDGAHGLSRRVVCDLLEWSGREVDTYHASSDMSAARSVIWAGHDPVPAWFDLARDLTERWVHQQQIRLAVGVEGHHAEKYLAFVIRTFIWAFPYQYRPVAEVGTQVVLDIGDAGMWTLTRADGGWEMDEGSCSSPAARVVMPVDVAWRSLTGAAVDPLEITNEGPVELTDAVRKVRGIIV
jgi:uncharacterized protein (TIGR03083 family)